VIPVYRYDGYDLERKRELPATEESECQRCELISGYDIFNFRQRLFQAQYFVIQFNFVESCTGENFRDVGRKDMVGLTRKPDIK
jgi:hypothetical protein